MTELLSKDHTILERPFMEFRPFGKDERGDKIRDISGVVVRANVDYLEECGRRAAGPASGEPLVQELCRRLNERIHDSAYHVNEKFLRNVWNSYSYEFVCFLHELCILISGDAEFVAHKAQSKHAISPVIKVLGLSFTLREIYSKWPYFGRKFTDGVIEYAIGPVTDHSAILFNRFTERAYRQFGPYRKRCAELVCTSGKASVQMIPAHIFHLPPATITDRTCIVNGDEWCEWDVRWAPQTEGGRLQSARNLLRRVQDSMVQVWRDTRS